MTASRPTPFRAAGLLLLAAATLCAGRTAPGETAPGKAAPRVWSLIVGIERYEQELDFPRCRGAARDALLLARWMIEDAGWPRDQVRLLADEPSEPVQFRDPAARPALISPTKAALEQGIGWLSERAKPGDVVVIYFAGQAVSLPPGPNDSAQRPPRDYLIPRDAAPNLDATGWRPQEAVAKLAAPGALSVVCLLDTSPMGRVRPPRFAGLPDRVAPELRTRMLQGIARWPGVTAWMAATERPAGETRAGHGAFTTALVGALGTRDGEKLNLQAALHRVRRARDLAGGGFRSVGDFAPTLSLWPGNVRLEQPPADPLVQRGHADRAQAIAFRGDGGRMITASMDSTVRIWRTSDSLLLHLLPWTSNGYHSLALGGDGRLLVAGGGKGDVLFFDTTTEARLTYDGAHAHRGPVTQVAVLADERRVVSLDGLGGRCVLWDTSHGGVRRLATPLEQGATRLAVAREPTDVAFALAARDAQDRDTVRLYGLDGKTVASFALPAPAGARAGDRPDRITALALGDAGDRVVAGTESGRVVECDVRGQRTRPDRRLPGGKVVHVEVAPLWVVATAGSSAHIVGAEVDPGAALKLDEPIHQVVVSADGRFAAACGEQGQVRAWEIAADGGSAAPIELGIKAAGAALSLAIAPGGDLLAVGDGDGQVRTWRIPQGDPRPAIAGATGRVGHLAVAPDGRGMLQITWDGRPDAPGKALVWRFGNERGARPVPGRFLQAGGFLRDGALVLLDEEGTPAIHDGVTFEQRLRFRRPPAENGRGETAWAFTSLAIDQDGRHVAGGSGDGPLVCVWNADDGQLLRTYRGAGDKVRAVSLSRNGRFVAAADDDGTTRVWDTADPDGAAPRKVLPPPDPNGVTAGTTVALSPQAPELLALGRRNGTAELWPPDARKPRALGPLAGEVKAVAFSPDGRYFAAAGDDSTIRLVRTDAPGRPITLQSNLRRRGLLPHHSEMITALAFWPDSKLLASASLDSTIRLWSLERQALIGTFTSSDDGVEWVVFTPDGHFDGSPEGERRVTWRLDPDWSPGEGDELIARFDQLGERFRKFDLADTLRRGLPPDTTLAKSPPAPPRLIVEPVAAVDPRRRDVAVRIRSVGPAVRDVRLYHNGVPVTAALERAGGEYQASVQLVHEKNEIYAMASRVYDPLGEGSVDALSNRLELRCDVETPGRIHIVALGVSRYKAQALRYAHADARALAAFLRQQGAEGDAVAEPIVLTDEEVTLGAVNDAFERVRRRVRGRPEDTVIVFLAGHAAVRRGLFCLMLHDADLPNAPIAPTAVALRGPVGEGAAALPPLQDPTVLPYRTIHFKLGFVDALRRLVIVDACQAEALFDNLEDRSNARRAFELGAFAQRVDRESRRSRTSYILATRRGERAAEPPELEHGLLTYTLLRGLGDRTLRRPDGLAIFQEYPSADFDGDGWISAGELQRYAQATMPALAERYQSGRRAAATARGPTNSAAPASVATEVADPAGTFLLVKAPRVQSD